MADAIAAQIDDLRRRDDQLARLRAKFPDLREFPTRWRKVLSSKLVNLAPSGVYTKHNCGCCADSPLEARFYVERHGEKVYTDPPEVVVGEKNPHYGEEWNDRPFDIWYDGWEGAVRKALGEPAVVLLQTYRGNEDG